MQKYTIGVDYGTDSVRSVIVDTENGNEVSASVFAYPRWKKGLYCNPAINQFRQHPLDYLEGLEFTIKDALAKAPAGVRENILAITVDTTGSTPVAIDKTGTPLSLIKGFEENPNAMFVLWKDHTALKEAEEINRLAKSWGGTDFTKYEGGIYSSEWFWAKILHVSRADKTIQQAAWSWLEHCDWIPALLTGCTEIKRIKISRCAAGHKAMWHPSWDGLPSEEFLLKLDPLLNGLRDRLYSDTFACDVAAGIITPGWADKLGVGKDVKIGVGAFDAHLGAVGGQIEPFYMSKVMGTSTCDMIVAPANELNDKLISGICGQVDGSIIPGMVGLEAGQSAFGDIYAWFKQILMWPAENVLLKSESLNASQKTALLAELSANLIDELSKVSSSVNPDETSVIALDWMNGRRTPDANQKLKGALIGLTLGTDAPKIFRALVEATAFGAKAIIDRFVNEGLRIDGVIALGGVAKKSDFVMQTVADVLNMPIRVARSEQACALGSAMAAAVVAGIYPDFNSAQKAMGQGFEKEYIPNREMALRYNTIYKDYAKLGALIEQNFA